MTTSARRWIVAGSLATALVVGAAGLVAAQDPSPTPTGMPAGACAGMMGGSGSAMMGGASAEMMCSGGGMMGGSRMMGTLSPEDLAAMTAMHDRMVATGICSAGDSDAHHSPTP